ncbi:MAG TPA: hypothetical protein VMG59_08755 [Phycisphaerae bacterium]|nr:hypothetical protein [Phycisphaerae bacterium]
MKFEIHKDVTITSKGQLTLPVNIRKVLHLGVKRKVRVAVTREGIVTMRPLPDVMSFFGTLHNRMAYNPNEKHRAREAIGRRAARKPR